MIRELRDSGHEPTCPHGGSVEAGLPVRFECVDFAVVGVTLREEGDHRLDVMNLGASGFVVVDADGVERCVAGPVGDGHSSLCLVSLTRVLHKLFDVGVVVDGDTDFKGSAEGVHVFHQG